MSRKRFVALVLLPLLAAPLAAADGDLDPSFWTDGTLALSAATDFGFGGLAANSAGELVLGFHFQPAGTTSTLAYWRTVGSTALGNVCRINLPEGSQVSVADLAFDALGRLLVLARAHDDFGRRSFWLLAFDYPTCGPVADYGDGGSLRLTNMYEPDFYGYFRLTPLAGGGTLVAGWDTDFNHPNAWSRSLALRVDSSATQLFRFRPPTDTLTYPTLAVDAAAATNGHVVTLSQNSLYPSSKDFLFFDFAADGTLAGTVTVPFNLGDDDDDVGIAIAATPDGRVVAVGSAAREIPLSSSAAMVMLHWNTDGVLELDPAFDGNGKKIFFFDSRPNSGLFDVAVQGDGRILVAGFADSRFTNFAMAVGRLLPDGSFDNEFDPDGTGRRLVDFEAGDPNDDVAYRVGLPNGRVALAGPVSFTGDVTSIGVARLLNAYVFASGFEPPEASGGWGFSPVPPP